MTSISIPVVIVAALSKGVEREPNGTVPGLRTLRKLGAAFSVTSVGSIRALLPAQLAHYVVEGPSLWRSLFSFYGLVIVLNEPSAIAALPTRSKNPMAPVVLACDSSMGRCHTSPKLHVTGAYNKVVVVGHKREGQNRKLM